jgi:competence protein ComEC
VNIIAIPGLQADIIAPLGNSYDDLNEWSAVVKLVYGETTFLLTGDAGEVSEAQIIADVNADVLKVGHHGSKTSTTLAFLSKVTPAHAIISVGEGNTYGHPADETLAALNAADVAIYRTDMQGTVIVTSDGESITVNTAPTPYQPGAPPVASSMPTTPPLTTVTPPPATEEPQSVEVYVTKTGEKYHRDGCHYLSRSKVPISLVDARMSYEPCSVCNPPQ